jgi:hypothetical protein
MKNNRRLLVLCLILLTSCISKEENVPPSPVYYKNIHLGDDISEVQKEIENLAFNCEADQSDTRKHYFSVSESSIKLGDEQLTPSVFAVFNSNNELISFRISYTYSGDKNLAKNLDWILIKKLKETTLPCLKGIAPNDEAWRKDSKIIVEFKKRSFASISYTVETK